MNFISYGDKSGAKRGLVRKNKDLTPDHYLQQNEGKWGFFLDSDDNPVACIGTVSRGLDDAGVGILTKMHGDSVETTPLPVDADEEIEEQAHAHPAFGAFAFGQLTAPSNNGVQEEPATRSQTLTKVERNRPEANGVKRPSNGTVCAQIWDLATEMSNGDEMPRAKIATLSEVVKAAESKGINKYTARTQYARWRVFHGLTGRLGS